jgi:hypothetical protein
MKRRSHPPKIGERYLLQFPGGVERIAEVAPGASEGETVLRPMAFEGPLPAAVLPGGEWVLDGGERMVRDWAGAYWSVSATAAPPRRLATGELPVACVIEFCRFAPPGTPLSYRAASIEWPEALSDERLVGVLRRAWEQLETDGGERLRRSNGKHSTLSELI